MEGFLVKKSRGDVSFTSRWLTDKNKSWTRKWFELDDQTITIYDDFNVDKGQPVGEEGSIYIKGCDILPVSHNSKKYIFCVKDCTSKNILLYVQAEDAKVMGCKTRLTTFATKQNSLTF